MPFLHSPELYYCRVTRSDRKSTNQGSTSHYLTEIREIRQLAALYAQSLITTFLTATDTLHSSEGTLYVIMSDVETDIKREEEQRREEDERLDTAEDERRPDDGTEEVRRAFLPPRTLDFSPLRDTRPTRPNAI